MSKRIEVCFIILFVMVSNGVLFAQSFHGEVGEILDNQTPTHFSVKVHDLPQKRLNGNYGLKSICLNITHPYVQNLRIKLISPIGSAIILVQNRGGSADHFIGTCFDDSANKEINSSSAPFTGTFKPEKPLGYLNDNQFGEGNWTLQVLDDAKFDNGQLVSWELNFGYNASQIEELNSDLPIIKLCTNGQTIKDSGNKIFATMIVINGSKRNSSLDSIEEFQGKVAIGIRGKFSATLPQKSYSLTAYKMDESKDSNVILFGLPIENDFILLANYNDKSFIRNMLMYELFREMGHYATRMKPCELIIDNEYMGIYHLVEKIKVDSERVNIEKMKSDEEVDFGYIFSHDYRDLGWHSQYAPALAPNKFHHFNFEYPSAKNIKTSQIDFIKNYVDKVHEAIQFHNDYQKWIDVPSFIDYLLSAELSWNEESFRKSMFFHKTTNGKLFAGPIWDFDWALKRHVYTLPDFAGWSFDLESYGNEVATLPWWKYLMEDTVFQNETRCRWESLRGKAFNFSKLNAQIDSMANLFQEAHLRHFAKWDILGKSVGTPELEPFSQTYSEEIASLKEMLQKRIVWIDAKLEGKCDLFSKEPIGWAFPNPAQNYVDIKIRWNPIDENGNAKKISDLKLFDYLGREKKMSFYRIGDEIFRIDLSFIDTGFYCVKLISEQSEVFNVKFTKQ